MIGFLIGVHWRMLLMKKNSKSKGPGGWYISVKDCSHALIDFSDKDEVRRCFIEQLPFPKRDVNHIIKKWVK